MHRRGLRLVLGLVLGIGGCGGSLQLRYGDTTLRVARGGNGTILLGTAPGMGERVATLPSGDVILTGSTGQASFLARVSSAGETKWKHALAYCGSSVDIVAPDDATVYVAAAGRLWVGDAASGVDRDCSGFSVVRLDGSGRERWRFAADRGSANIEPRLAASSTMVVVGGDGPGRSSLVVGIDATTGLAAWRQPFEDGGDELRLVQNARTVFSATCLPDPSNCIVRAMDATHGGIVWEKTVSSAGERCGVARMWATDAELVVYGASSSEANGETQFLSVLDANSGERHRHHEPLDVDSALRARHEGVPALKTGEVVVVFGGGENAELLALDPKSGKARWVSQLRSLDERRGMLWLKDLAIGPDAIWGTGYFAGRIGSNGVTLRAPPDIYHPPVDLRPALDEPVWPLFLFRQPIVRVDHGPSARSSTTSVVP